MVLETPPALPLPLPFPPWPEYDVWEDHTLAGCVTPSEGPRTGMLVESKRAPGGVGVDVDGRLSPEVGDVIECVGACRGVVFSVSAGTYTPPSSVLPFGESVCCRSLTRSVPAPYVAMTPRRPRLSVTNQTKPLEESMPVAAAVTYVLSSCREPICAAITPSRVWDFSGFTHLSVNATSWFGDVPVGGFYSAPIRPDVF